MTTWTWPLVVVIGLVLAAIVVMFGLSDDPSMQTRLLGYLDTVVPFVVGAGAGAAAGGSVGFLKGARPKLRASASETAGALGTDWTWPLVVLIGLVLAAIVTMFGLTHDAAMRSKLLGYFDAVVPFVVGAGAGAAVGGVVGYLRGRQ
jgi:uncharacterized membrane protein